MKGTPMARARMLHPGFFENADLAACAVAARLLFCGLWCIADKCGRCEDRPEFIRGRVFPFERIKVEPLLRELAAHGFIERYRVDSLRLIQVCQWTEYQRPHHREAPSHLPPPDGHVDVPGHYEVGARPRAKPRAEHEAEPEAEPRAPRAKSRAEPGPNPGPNPSVFGVGVGVGVGVGDSVPVGTAAAVASSPPDSADVIFGLGVPMLVVAGLTDRQSRSMLGLFRKQHTDAEVIGAIQRCASEKPIEPVAWLQAALRSNGVAAGGKPRRIDALIAGNVAAAKRFMGGAK
jgi:hypothetical protein